MVFNVKQCRATSKKTGEQCRQPALDGSEFCRLHGENKSAAAEPKAKRPRRRKNAGEKAGNVNSRKHGAYTMRLLPEEEPIYHEKLAAFSEALGSVDIFDQQLLHLLALISTKVDQAVMKGAEHAAYAELGRFN